MRYVRIIILLLTALVLVIFSVQNSDFATIEFLSWSSETSMALLLLISFLIGSFVTFMFLLPSIFKKRKTKVIKEPVPAAPAAPAVESEGVAEIPEKSK